MEETAARSKYPEGLNRSVTERLISGHMPRSQIVVELRGVIERCRAWPTPEAALLAEESEMLLAHVTGETVERAIRESMETGERVEVCWASKWVAEDLLSQATNAEADTRMADICGLRDGRPWCVRLVDPCFIALLLVSRWARNRCKEQADKAMAQADAKPS